MKAEVKGNLVTNVSEAPTFGVDKLDRPSGAS